ncbi:unnamed protein product [Coffea canephora]|uniref:DH200=94 genomic scaffold, scaffold_1092 n=1 Tax=Coffea canephora TaxID=49390 RepID=A0A068VIC1_COFCA|nr:unnamed protein product [Coffea canephora]
MWTLASLQWTSSSSLARNPTLHAFSRFDSVGTRGWLVFLKGVLPYSWDLCFMRSLKRPFEPQSFLFQNQTLSSQMIAFTREVMFALPSCTL